MGVLAGIDLGTSTSEIAIFKEGKAELIRDVRQSRFGILPSAVALDPLGNPIVGKTAARAWDTVVREFKREMGEEHEYSLGDKRVSPVELSSHVLRHLKENAERVEGAKIDEAVITVPAAFKHRARQATIDAARQAGLNVERVINEPTAAALAYGIDNLDAEQSILVFDLGGGTFDVSILKMRKGVLEVIASAGDKHLGGSDFDNVLFQLLAKDIEAQSGVAIERKPASKASNQLNEKAEEAKIDLSDAEAVSVDIPYLGDHSIDFHAVITRKEFELASRGLIERLGRFLDQALQDAQLSPQDVDEVLLVGGSTRVPAVQAYVSDYFGGRALPQRVPPDEAVALGAAIQVGLKTGAIDSRSGGLVATDVTPHSLGVAVVELQGGVMVPDRMSIIVERQTTKPVQRTSSYATTFENQEEVLIRVFEGEHPDASKNDLAGEFKLSGIPPGPAGTERIDVSIGVDINGVAVVEGVIASTGESANCVVTTGGQGAGDTGQDGLDDRAKESPFYSQVQPLLEAADRTKKEKNLSADDVRRIEDLVRKVKEALAVSDESAIERLEEELTDLLFDLQ